MKRGEFTDNEIRVTKAVEDEYELFKYKMLSRSRAKIFERCSEIRFYSCIHEYFLYAEDIKDVHIRACLKCGKGIIETLYQLYMKWEYLRCDRWTDIEELLDVLAERQENCSMQTEAQP